VSQETKLAFQDLAVTELEREIARNPDSARLRLFSGSLYGGIGQIEKSEAEFRKVVELAPTKQSALFQLGEILMLQNKNDEAVEVYKRAYELEKEFDQAATYYAISLVRAGRDKEAVELLTQHYGTVIVEDDRLFAAWAEAKRFDIVVAILEEKIAKNPDNVQHIVSLAAAYKELGNLDKAVALLTNVKEDKPEYAEQMDDFIKDLRGW
jgi:tetratricopeptide (TPR) repeat protein